MKYVKDAAQTKVITDTEGLWHFYFDKDTQALIGTQVWDDDIILLHVYVATLYWDALNDTAITLNEERHGFMPGPTHLEIHKVLGSRWDYGLLLNEFNVDQDGSLATHAQFGQTVGQITDEDIPLPIPAEAAPTTYPIFYRDGANGYVRKDAATNFTCKTHPSGRLAFNEWTGATWQQTQVEEGHYVLAFIVATNNIADPVIVIQGTKQYDTKSLATLLARSEAFEIIADADGLPVSEKRMLGAVIFQTSSSYTNSVEARIVSTLTGEDYIDLRDVVLIAGDVIRLRTSYQIAASNNMSTYNHRKCIKITANGNDEFSFSIPTEAVDVVGIYAIVEYDDTFTDEGVWLSSTYAGVGELGLANQETDNTNTYTNSVADTLVELDLTSVFTNVGSGDICGVNINHRAIAANGYYYGVRVDYLAY